MTKRDFWIGLLEFVLLRRRLYDRAARHDLELSRETNLQRREEWPDGVPAEAIEAHAVELGMKFQKLRGRFLSAIWLFTSAAAAGVVPAVVMSLLDFGLLGWARNAVLVVALGCFLISTFARLGWEGQTIKGVSFSEQFDQSMSVLLYWLATALAVFGAVAPGANGGV